jgi:hypothetical protein
MPRPPHRGQRSRRARIVMRPPEAGGADAPGSITGSPRSVSSTNQLARTRSTLDAAVIPLRDPSDAARKLLAAGEAQYLGESSFCSPSGASRARPNEPATTPAWARIASKTKPLSEPRQRRRDNDEMCLPHPRPIRPILMHPSAPRNRCRRRAPGFGFRRNDGGLLAPSMQSGGRHLPPPASIRAPRD